MQYTLADMSAHPKPNRMLIPNEKSKAEPIEKTKSHAIGDLIKDTTDTETDLILAAIAFEALDMALIGLRINCRLNIALQDTAIHASALDA